MSRIRREQVVGAVRDEQNDIYASPIKRDKSGHRSSLSHGLMDSRVTVKDSWLERIARSLDDVRVANPGGQVVTRKKLIVRRNP